MKSTDHSATRRACGSLGYVGYSRAGCVTSALLAISSVATVLLPIGLLYDWVVADVQPYEQQEFWILMILVAAQCILFWLNAFLYFCCYLKQKEMLATQILRHCRRHEQLFSYWDRVQAHLWEYWLCYDLVLTELVKCAASVAVAAWILWDVTLLMLGTLLTMFIGCHFANMKFWTGMMRLDRGWVAFFEQRAFEWVRHRQLLQHYRRWTTVVSIGITLLNNMHAASVSQVRGFLYLFSRLFFMLTITLTGTVAPVLLVPLLTSASSISPKNLWMLSAMLALVVSSAGRIANSSGSFVLHKDRLRVLRAELQSNCALDLMIAPSEAVPAPEITRDINLSPIDRRHGDDLESISEDGGLTVSSAQASYSSSFGQEARMAQTYSPKDSIVLENVTVCQGQVVILHKICLTLPLGKRVAIIGPSGSGKTTLMETIIGLRPVTDGAIIFRTAKGDSTAKQKEVFSYVPAVSNAVIFRNESWRFNLLLERPVAAVISSSPTTDSSSIAENSKCERGDRFAEEAEEDTVNVRQMSEQLVNGSANTDKTISDLLRSLNFPEIDLSAPADRGLSQGETQRFLLSRAFLSGLPAVFLDEAFSALSADQRHALWVRTLHHFKTVFYICHDGLSLQEADVALFVIDGKVEVVDASMSSPHYWVQRMRKADGEG